jgi:hypothetical protein
MRIRAAPGVVTTTGLRTRLARRWGAFSATLRRRIVLGSLLVLSLAARDALLLLVAAAFFALGEMVPAPRKAPAAL